MKGIDFLTVLGDIEPTYIEEIDHEASPKTISFSYKHFASIAASLFIICMVSFSGYRYFHQEELTQNDHMPSTVEFTRELSVEPIEIEEETFFEKIIEKVVSFFENLRSL